MNKILGIFLSSILLLSTTSCDLLEWAALSSSNSNEERGAIIGASSGARTGAFIGSLTGDHSMRNSAIGAVAGAVGGALIGSAIGKSIDNEHAQQAQYDNRTYIGDRKLGNAIYFKQKKSGLNKESKRMLKEVARQLRNDPSACIEIYGHTDDYGTYAERRQRSVARANEVARYLVSQGVAGERIYAKGCADQYPVGDNRTTDGRAQNRRVEIVITHPR